MIAQFGLALRSTSRRRIATAIVTAAVIAAVSSTAQHPSAAAPPPVRQLNFVAQTPWVRMGATSFNLKLGVVNADPNDLLVIDLFAPVTSTVQFGDLVGGGELSPASRTDVELPIKARDLVLDRHGITALKIPLLMPGNPNISNSLNITAPGIYPVRVSLRSRSALHAEDPRILTWLVVTDPKVAPDPIDLAWIWRLPNPDLSEQPLVGLRALNADAALLEHVGFPITVLATPATLTSWREAATADRSSRLAFQAFMTHLASPTRSVLNAPYADVDPIALTRRGLNSIYREQLDLGTDLLTHELKLSIASHATMLWNADSGTLDALAKHGVTNVVLAERSLQPIDTALRDRRFNVRGSNSSVLSTAQELAALAFAGSDPAALRAQRFVASIALLGATQPGAGLVLTPPQGVEPSPAVVHALQRVLLHNPFVRMTNIDKLFATIAPGTNGQGGALVRDLAPQELHALSVDVPRATQLRARFGGYIQLVGPRDASVAVTHASFLRAFDRAITVERASHQLDLVQATIDAFASHVAVTKRTVTLTSERSRVPLAITNTSGHTLRVRIHLESPKLAQIEPDLIVDLPRSPTNQTERISVRVRGGGEFPVHVIVTSPDGSLVLGEPVTITMNSTVFGAYGSLLTYCSLAFLAIWWIRHGWKRRKLPLAVTDA